MRSLIHTRACVLKVNVPITFQICECLNVKNCLISEALPNNITFHGIDRVPFLILPRRTVRGKAKLRKQKCQKIVRVYV